MSEHADTTTRLTSRGLPLAKVWRRNAATGDVVEERYSEAKHFTVRSHDVASIRDFARVLDFISRDEYSAVIRGQIRPEVHPANARKLKANFDDVPRRWSLHDFDGVPCPAWIDWRADPESAVDHTVFHLRPQFHNVTCWWMFSGSQGMKPGLRMRLAFWHDRPVSGAELTLWLGEKIPSPPLPRGKWPRVCPVDVRFYLPTQFNYIAAPLFYGVDDPVARRSGLRVGASDTVITPYPIEPRHAAPLRSSVAGAASAPEHAGHGYEFHRERIGDDGDGFYEPILSAVASYFGRHGTSADAAWLLSDLTEATRAAAASLSPARAADAEDRIAKIPGMVEWACEQEARKEAEKRAPGALCDAPALLPTMPLREAEGALAVAVDDAFADCRAWLLQAAQRQAGAGA